MIDDAESPRSPTSDGLRTLIEDVWATTRPYAELRSSLPSERFVEVDGRQVYVEQTGRGEPLVLLHGFACSSFSWRAVVPTLSRGYRVINVDLPGFGYSERPEDPTAYTVPAYGRMVLEVLDRLGVGACHLMGHSFGGALAVWLAAHHPERVRSLVLVASALPEYMDEQRQLWARFRSLNYLLLHGLFLTRGSVRKDLETCYYDASLVSDELVDAYRDRLLVEGVEEAFFGFMAPCDDAACEAPLEAIEAPALVVWGAHDRVIPLDRAEAEFHRLARGRIVVFERCGHAPMEELPRKFLRVVLPFLAAHRPSLFERLRSLLGREGWAGRLPRPALPPLAPPTATP